jgi:hypothetical protein
MNSAKSDFALHYQRDKIFTTRLQKGGALFEDMRQLVLVSSEELPQSSPIANIARSLPKSTKARVKDTYIRAFRPRFIEGSPPHAWRLSKILEERKADIQILRPFYYWVTARAEAPLYEFVSDIVFSRSRSIDRQIRIEETVSWLANRIRQEGKAWSPTVNRKVARGILASLRDFGILEGATHKRVSTSGLPPRVFTIIAFLLHEMGASGRELVSHPDWRLFLLGDIGVERLFLECHQYGWLKFDLAGDLRRIEFPVTTFLEYTHAVLS